MPYPVMRNFLLFLTFLPFAISTQAAPGSESEEFILFQKTACFGRCPVFNYYLFSNGKYIFEGIANTEFDGTHTGELDPSIFNEAISYLLRNDVNSFKSMYISSSKVCTSLMTDQPSTNITIQSDELVKEIAYDHGCGFDKANELRDLLTGLSAIIGLGQWE